MTLKVKILQIICIFAMLAAAPQPTVADTAKVQELNKALENFGVRLYTELAKENPKKNIVFSPFSIQTCLTMARMGAEGETAAQLDKGLTLSVQNTEDLSSYYQNILAEYANSKVLKMANKIYAMKGYDLQKQFNEVLSKHFYSNAETINFAQNTEAANKINTWVEDETNNLIKDLIDPSLLNADTRLVLVNAIYFKGDWLHKFKPIETRDRDFYLDETNKIKVPMMRNTEYFNYGEFSELDAKILEMPYKNCDLSMLVILPNKRTGLADVQNKLKDYSLSELLSEMSSTRVIVDLPKFKAEFQIELTDHLSKLGIKRMFSDQAEFGKMLESPENLKVSTVVHKAHIEVNEVGTEAAAATAGVMQSRMAYMLEETPKRFTADRPLIFIIINSDNVIIFRGVFKNNS